ncbi:hypothetical protein TanjilG_16886 [Lupinus angustifolius]|uniref:uncharacterized protein LOC109336253 isoform X1 n=1 Tax=Lupinus angustifolius TaxID=3871 RepID=UPI00090D56BE|nr:PREDICTED: uncharacterized protein LOC109336253 isoform X1 [Lupinus angustifolius]XP_019428279.1 PREDICTED: uncharacterized protein LOC109336253 isoform X1 [Lupinus angustifolius]XP_019428280.1 PREDICTED: uncharacterized protein LOC109336253 isoform X1 [Lupinus angustifolius]XP_019428281.1 PREDICTED: uncharacterized protein LOC109336253 isoform X1 [Lupinus angustifolius]OIV90926.1 hypothetical protein TanjilG_16886 [Lupinus angustifolius]
MKQFSILQQQNVVVSSSREDMKDSLICPKPRRLALFNDLSSCSFGSNPLDTILTKGDCEEEQFWPDMSSPPSYFFGSPPSRVANPLVHDARFGDVNFPPFSSLSRVVVPGPSGLSSSPSPSSARKGGCVRANFGNNPGVRVEGFDCLDRDRRNCSIPALA